MHASSSKARHRNLSVASMRATKRLSVCETTKYELVWRTGVCQSGGRLPLLAPFSLSRGGAPTAIRVHEGAPMCIDCGSCDTFTEYSLHTWECGPVVRFYGTSP